MIVYMLIGSTVCSIIIDIVMAACPIILLYNVNMKRRLKVQLCMLMGLGFM